MSSKLAKHGEFIGSGAVSYKLVGQPNAPTAIQLRVDYSAAPDPENYYYADYYEVHDLDPEVLFVFGKLNRPGGEQLRNKIEVYFPAQQLVGQLWKTAPVFFSKLQDFARKKGCSALSAGTLESGSDNVKVQVIRSNNAFMAQFGTEALIDFFSISPSDLLLKAKNHRTVQLNALVRVEMSVEVLWGFLAACEPIALRLEPKYGQQGETDEAVESD